MSERVDELFLRVLGTLNEAQARWFVAQEAIARGRGGIQAIHELTGISRPRIVRGIRELESGERLQEAPDRVRLPGAGRPRLTTTDPDLNRSLERIMQETTAGDPMSLLRWTSKSTARIAEELSRQGHSVSGEWVRGRLHELGYSLQQNAKTKEGSSPSERDAQFRYINRLVRRFLRAGDPVLSVDAKKHERVGEFKNAGQTWRKKKDPVRVNMYDYPHLGEGPAIPYGTYDVARNRGFVSVGMSAETAEFAVESIRRWWRSFGRRHYPNAHRLLICCDGGGSNGSRNNGWKVHLQQFADRNTLAVTVCHYPPGTSKWNKIEHRMFSHISLNWRGQPLVSYETVVNLISATRTATGLKIKAVLDERVYEKGVKISKEQLSHVNLKPHRTHPSWNYTIEPR